MDTLRERAAFFEHAHEFVEGLGGKALESFMIAPQAVIFAEPEKKLKRALNAVERIVYLDDAFGAVKREKSLTSGPLAAHTAYKLGIRSEQDQHRKAVALRRMNIEVFGSKSISKLIDLSHYHPTARTYLVAHQKTITKEMKGVTDIDFEWYESEPNVDQFTNLFCTIVL